MLAKQLVQLRKQKTRSMVVNSKVTGISHQIKVHNDVIYYTLLYMIVHGYCVGCTDDVHDGWSNRSINQSKQKVLYCIYRGFQPKHKCGVMVLAHL